MAGTSDTVSVSLPATGIALSVRPVHEHEVGRAPVDLDRPVAAVVRDGQLRNFGHPDVQRLAPGDRLVCIEDVDRGIDDPTLHEPDGADNR